MTNLQDRVRAEASVCERKPGPKASQKCPEHLPAIGGTCAVGSSTSRRLHKGRIPHGLRDVASTSSVAGATGRYCYSIVSCGTFRATPAQNGPLCASSIVISLLLTMGGRPIARTPPRGAAGDEFGETNPRCRSATPLAPVTSLRSHAAHRPRCGGLRWPRGSRNTWRPEGGCPGSARRSSRW
jgi:hypothetical protein